MISKPASIANSTGRRFAQALRFCIVVAALLRGTAAQADEVSNVLHEYHDFVTEVVKNRTTWPSGKRKQESLQWYAKLLLVARDNPQSPHAESALKKALGLANSYGSGVETEEVVAELLQVTADPAGKARWNTELGELYRLKYEARGDARHLEIALKAFGEAERDWRAALPTAPDDERARILGELAFNKFCKGCVLLRRPETASDAARSFGEAGQLMASDPAAATSGRLSGFTALSLVSLIQLEAEGWAKSGDLTERDNAITRMLAMCSKEEGARKLYQIASSAYGESEEQKTELMAKFLSNGDIVFDIQSAYEIAESYYILKKYGELLALSESCLQTRREQLEAESKEQILSGSGGALAGMYFFAGESAFQLDQFARAKQHFEMFAEISPNDPRLRLVRGRLAEIAAVRPKNQKLLIETTGSPARAWTVLAVNVLIVLSAIGVLLYRRRHNV